MPNDSDSATQKAGAGNVDGVLRSVRHGHYDVSVSTTLAHNHQFDRLGLESGGIWG